MNGLKDTGNGKMKKKKQKIKIIDDFLDKELFKKLQNFLLGDECPWFYNESSVYVFYNNIEKGKPGTFIS